MRYEISVVNEFDVLEGLAWSKIDDKITRVGYTLPFNNQT
jgi:hypothetical protein